MLTNNEFYYSYTGEPIGITNTVTTSSVVKTFSTFLVKVEDPALTPTKATEGSAGFDLRAKKETVLPNCERVLVGTGVRAKIPKDHVGLLFPRSSLSKQGITMTNSVGVIDSDYRGEIMASLMYRGEHMSWIIPKHERIVQLVIVPVPRFEVSVDKYSTEEQWNNTARGTGGFGSTGKT